MIRQLVPVVRRAVRTLSRGFRNPVEAILCAVGAALARAGYVDSRRVERTTRLAWPRIVTGLARTSNSIADLAMIGAAVGTTAVAGVGIATPFAFLAGTLGGGIAGGTISLVSQRFGADRYDELDVVVKQSVWLVLLVCAPLVVAFWSFPRELVGLVATDPETLEYGATYLRVMSVGTAFIGLNLVGSRTLVGVDDSYSAMVVRVAGAIVNLGLNGVFVFGLGMGVAGAALGSVIANAAVTALFVYGFFGGWLPFVGRFPVTVSPGGPYVDRALSRDLIEISAPIALTNATWSTAQFPLLAVVAVFGPEVVAAFVVSRRVRGLMDTPSWGLNLASSSLVGQHLGRADEGEAAAYGRDIVRLTVAVYVLGAAAVFLFATPIAAAFVDGGATVAQTATFVRVAAISVVFNGLNSAASGPLTASGDTQWPFYGRAIGLYGFALPVAYVGTVAVPVPLLGAVSFGILALYAALVVETLVPAAITTYRFATGRWKVVSRSYRPDVVMAD